MESCSERRALSNEQRERYARHIALREIGETHQRRLLNSRVLLVGAGGLGSAAATYLTAAGIGTLGIVDGDQVRLSDLQRQILYDTRDIGQPKVQLAYKRLRELNPDIYLIPYQEMLTVANALDLVGAYDLIIDATDTLPSRYLLSDACVLAGKPLVHGSVLRFQGQATVFNHRGGPCYRCVYPSPPVTGRLPTCQEEGVLNVVPALIGLIEATETIKILLGQGDILSGRLLLYDAWRLHFDVLEIHRDRACSTCGEAAMIESLRSENYGDLDHKEDVEP